ncbi:WW domain protein [Cooperia oncophora]
MDPIPTPAMPPTQVVETVLSPESHDSGVVFENQYSKPLRVNPPPPVNEEEPKQLPPGWEKHQDPSGFSYYWHVDSGTIQREPPRAQTPPRSPSPPPPIYSRTTYSRETQADAPPEPQVTTLPPQIQRVHKQTCFQADNDETSHRKFSRKRW